MSDQFKLVNTSMRDIAGATTKAEATTEVDGKSRSCKVGCASHECCPGLCALPTVHNNAATRSAKSSQRADINHSQLTADQCMRAALHDPAWPHACPSPHCLDCPFSCLCLPPTSLCKSGMTSASLDKGSNQKQLRSDKLKGLNSDLEFC
jgi:hypothetical protein